MSNSRRAGLIEKGPSLPDERTSIDFLLAADFAQVVNGKVYVVGGAWDTFSPPSYPAQMRLGVLVGIRVPYLEANIPQHAVVTIRSGDGQEHLKLEADLETGRPPGRQGDSILVPIAVNAQLALAGPQLVEVVAHVADASKRISIRAMPRPTAALQSRAS